MKDEELPTTTKKDSGDGGALCGKGGYKLWVFGAILLLAFWSMFASTVSLKWSAGNLNQLTDDTDAHLHDDLDVLEIEEREKVVKQMWEVYTHSHRIRLPRFWQEAFEAAYEQLESDALGVRAAAISEIAKMSMRTIDLEPPPRQQMITLHLTKSKDQETQFWNSSMEPEKFDDYRTLRATEMEGKMVPSAEQQ